MAGNNFLHIMPGPYKVFLKFSCLQTPLRSNHQLPHLHLKALRQIKASLGAVLASVIGHKEVANIEIL